MAFVSHQGMWQREIILRDSSCAVLADLVSVRRVEHLEHAERITGQGDTAEHQILPGASDLIGARTPTGGMRRGRFRHELGREALSIVHRTATQGR